MRVAMEEVAKTLTLWHTRTFRPIFTHDDLDPIMAAAGFIPVPVPTSSSPSSWREYAFCSVPADVATAARLPLPRLPFPRVDGVHIAAFRAFFEAMEFYLGAEELADLFHVRDIFDGVYVRQTVHQEVQDIPFVEVFLVTSSFCRAMPITKLLDRSFERLYRPMRDCGMGDDGIYVYREGTLDSKSQTAFSYSSDDDSSSFNINICNKRPKMALIGKYKKRNSSSIYLVPLKDLFPGRDTVSLG